MLKKKKKLLVSILSIILLFSMAGTASAEPLSEMYYQEGYDYNTYAMNVELNNMGYTANKYKGTTAYYVRNTMDDDIVFVNCSKSYPGRMLCKLGTGFEEELTADSTTWGNGYSLEAKFNAGDFTNMKLAYYCGPETGLTDNNNDAYDFGNLLNRTTALYADVAIGFTADSDQLDDDDLELEQVSWFNGYLFAYLRDGYTVEKSIEYALYYTEQEFGPNDMGGVDTITTSGSTSITIN